MRTMLRLSEVVSDSSAPVTNPISANEVGHMNKVYLVAVNVTDIDTIVAIYQRANTDCNCI